MGYAQWVAVNVIAKNCDLKIQNANLKHGKFHKCSNKDENLEPSKINAITILAGNSAKICSCGKLAGLSGTEGQFDIYSGQTKIGTYYWECPYSSPTNTSKYRAELLDDYCSQHNGGNLESGALGDITIRVVKF